MAAPETPDAAPTNDSASPSGDRRLTMRSIIAGAGRVLIATGVMLLGFVAYQLWGTGLETARSQRDLTATFNEVLATAPTTATAPPTTIIETDEPPVAEPPGVVQDLGEIDIGDPIAFLKIPALRLDEVLIAGVGLEELRAGPGHFPESSFPGQYGRAAIAGHRTAWGEPFRRLDRLRPGDEIITTTRAGRFVYRVIETEIVEPTDYDVVLTEDPDRADLVLVTCHPAFTTDKRMIVTALLDETESDPIGRTLGYLPTDEPAPEADLASSLDDATDLTIVDPSTATSDDTTTATSGDTTTATSGDTTDDTTAGASTAATPPTATGVDDGLTGSWFGDTAATVRMAIWGLALIIISTGAWLLSRRTGRDLIGAGVGIIPFVIASFFFFQNLVRVVPSGV